MRKYLLLLLLFSLILPTFGQENNDRERLFRCQSISSELDLSSACQQYLSCSYEQDCLGQLIVSILQQCRAKNLSLCEERSTLYAIAITEGKRFYNLGDVDPLLASALAFDAEDYSTAAWIIEAAMTTDELHYFPFYTHYLALGIIYNVIGESDLALQNYNESINIHFFSPLPFYFRGRLYESMGDTEHAYRDYYTYTELASPYLQQNLTLDYFTYSLPDAENWVAYPVLSRGDGVVATTFADLTLQPSFLVRMVLLDDTTVGVSDLSMGSIDLNFKLNPNILFLEQDEVNPEQYTLMMIYQDFPGSRSRIQLDLRIFPTYIEYVETVRYFEGGGVSSGVLLPEGELDPRFGIGNRPCAGLPISRIQIGDEVTGTYGDNSNLWYMWTAPLETSDRVFDNYLAFREVSTGVKFIAQEGPLCIDNTIWWRISAGDIEGWMPESVNTNYYMMTRELFDMWGPWQGEFPSPAELLGLNDEFSP